MFLISQPFGRMPICGILIHIKKAIELSAQSYTPIFDLYRAYPKEIGIILANSFIFKQI